MSNPCEGSAEPFNGEPPTYGNRTRRQDHHTNLRKGWTARRHPCEGSAKPLAGEPPAYANRTCRQDRRTNLRKGVKEET